MRLGRLLRNQTYQSILSQLVAIIHAMMQPLWSSKMLLTDDILDKIVEQTNLYARQYITSHDLSPRSRVHGWSREPFTRDELLKFISLIIVMGLVNLPTLEDHWMTTWPYSSQTCTKDNRESIQAYTGNVCSMFLACHLLYALGFLYI